MIYLLLFLNFFKIGIISFGGGYGMISVIHDTVRAYNWLSEEEFLNFIAVSESTPGPIAVNIATFIGSAKGGILGSFFATLGVVLPSFIIILIIAAVFNKLLKLPAVSNALKGIRPCIVAMILATGFTMFLTTFLNINNIESTITVNYKAFLIIICLFVISFIFKKVKNKKPSPILLILLSAFMGIIFNF